MIGLNAVSLEEDGARLRWDEDGMYIEFYGLTEKPFNLTPAPKFLYMPESRNGGKHGDALAHMRYGVENRSGFVLITGEAGAGKTTICRSFANGLDGNVELALVFKPKMTAIELLRKINREFGLPSSGETILDLVETLNVYLLDAAASSKTCVLVIDEAQNLSPEVLEQIRLLSNLETDTEKLLQIILLGQPELNDKLRLEELRQLNQRITTRYHLTPLDEQETLEYIAYRLHIAGSKGGVRFEKNAVRLIHGYAQGTPRLINAICDRALLIGYTQSARVITKSIVQRAAEEVRGDSLRAPVRRNAPRPPSRFRAWAPAVLGVAAALAVGIGWGTWFERFSQRESAPPSAVTPGSLPETKNASLPGTRLEGEAGVAPVSAQPGPLAAAAPEPPGKPVSSVNSLSLWIAPLDPTAIRQAAGEALLHAWNLPDAHDGPQGDSPADFAKFAEKYNLDADSLEAPLSAVMAINLPVFLALRRQGSQCWVTLLARKDNKAQLSGIRGMVFEADLEDLEKHYAGRAVAFWRDPARGKRLLRVGQRGPDVAQLKQELWRLGRLTPEHASDEYDAATAQAVSKLQADTGLRIDGMAGRQVRMVLSSWLGNESVPMLAARPALLDVPPPPLKRATPPPRKKLPARNEKPPAPEAAPPKKSPEMAAAPSLWARPAIEEDSGTYLDWAQEGDSSLLSPEIGETPLPPAQTTTKETSIPSVSLPAGPPPGAFPVDTEGKPK